MTHSGHRLVIREFSIVRDDGHVTPSLHWRKVNIFWVRPSALGMYTDGVSFGVTWGGGRAIEVFLPEYFPSLHGQAARMEKWICPNITFFFARQQRRTWSKIRSGGGGEGEAAVFLPEYFPHCLPHGPYARAPMVVRTVDRWHTVKNVYDIYSHTGMNLQL